MYQNGLKNLKNIFLPQKDNIFSKNIYWVFGLVLKNNNKLKLDRQMLCKKLLKKGIETRPFFWPIHKQPIFKKFGKEILKNSEYLSKNGFYLPSGTALKNKEIRYIINEVKKIIK